MDPTQTRTRRIRRMFQGIRGLTKEEDIIPRLATIGRLHKGAARTKEDVEKKRPGKDLDHFRFTSEREDVVKAFYEAFGATPRVINCYLPFPTTEESFQTSCEEWVAGGLVHRCDGDYMTFWRDEHGAPCLASNHDRPEPCPYGPYASEPRERTRQRPGCRPVGRLFANLPELLEAGFVGPVVLITTSINDINRITDALKAVEEARGDSLLGLRGILFTLRRVPERISTPGDNGGRVRRKKWLVVVEPAVEWVQLQLAAARAEAMPALPEPVYEEPDWEDVTTSGRTVGEVEAERRAARRNKPAVVEGTAKVVEEQPAEDLDGEDLNGHREAAKALWNDVIWPRAGELGWQGNQRGLLSALGHDGLLGVHQESEEDGREALLERLRRVVYFPQWPQEVVDRALEIPVPDPANGGESTYYAAEPHVRNALGKSGLAPDAEPEVLLDWLASHARERVSQKAAEDLKKRAAQGPKPVGQGELFPQEEVICV